MERAEKEGGAEDGRSPDCSRRGPGGTLVGQTYPPSSPSRPTLARRGPGAVSLALVRYRRVCTSGHGAVNRLRGTQGVRRLAKSRGRMLF